MRITVLFIIYFLSIQAFAHLNHRPDGHAPIGVMGDHGHKKGELMLSYRVMYMNMSGLRQGGNDITHDDLFTNSSFMMAPKSMDMWMHMVGGMYGLTDNLTLALMLPYTSKEMSMYRRMQNDSIDTQSHGIGDIKLNGIYTFLEDNKQRLISTLSLSAPTGKIDYENNGVRQGYPMQIGSDTYGLGLTLLYSEYFNNFSMNGQVGVKTKLGRNDDNYRLGTRYFLNLWASYKFNDSWSSSLRYNNETLEAISGVNRLLNPMMSPANNTSSDRKTHNILIGVNYLGKSFLKGHRLAIEIGAPFYQELGGTQLKNKYIVNLGWQKSY